ncbi:MAG: LemA family protein [Wujia sp.]
MKINIELIIFAVIVILIIRILAYIIKTINSLVRLRNKAIELNSDVDVALAKRYDLLKKQYSAVKMYCSHESKTLIETIKMRTGLSGSEKSNVSSKLNDLAQQLKITMEAYPELKANEQFMMLQRSCDKAEEHLQAARRLYNTSVTNYNNMCSEFPSSIIAAISGHKTMEYFQTEAEKRNDFEFT